MDSFTDYSASTLPVTNSPYGHPYPQLPPTPPRTPPPPEYSFGQMTSPAGQQANGQIGHPYPQLPPTPPRTPPPPEYSLNIMASSENQHDAVSRNFNPYPTPPPTPPPTQSLNWTPCSGDQMAWLCLSRVEQMAGQSPPATPRPAPCPSPPLPPSPLTISAY